MTQNCGSESAKHGVLLLPLINSTRADKMPVLCRQSIVAQCLRSQMVYREDDVPLKFEPVSIDLHLGEVLLEDVIYKKGMILLKPGVFCLGSTIELFNMPPNVVGFIVGKSTIAREGIQIEAAGLVDPGFAGHVTLELKNLHHSEHITLIPGQPIGQVYFQYLDEPSDALYGYENGNHYQNQRGVTPSYRKKN